MSTALEKLESRHHAALVVLSLDEAVAADLLRNLDENDLRRLANAVSEVDGVPPDTIGRALEEYDRRLNAPMAGKGGDYLRTLATTALGRDRALRVFEPPAPGPPQNPLEAIRGARSSVLAELLQDEHPQVAAVVVSQLPNELAVEVLQAMPEALMRDLTSRVAMLEEIPTQALEVASEGLLRALTAAGGLTSGEPANVFDGVDFVAGLLNSMENDASERLLGSLDEKVAGRIREAMFTFEDLTELDGKQLQLLLREIPGDKLILALRTAAESTRERFFAAMSQRAAENLREELGLMGPKKLSEVEAAQREIVEVSLRLAAAGTLTLPGRGDDEVV